MSRCVQLTCNQWPATIAAPVPSSVQRHVSPEYFHYNIAPYMKYHSYMCHPWIHYYKWCSPNIWVVPTTNEPIGWLMISCSLIPLFIEPPSAATSTFVFIIFTFMPNDDAKTNHHKRRRNTSHDVLLIWGGQSLRIVIKDIIRTWFFDHGSDFVDV